MKRVIMVLGAASLAVSGCAPIIYGESRKVNKEAIVPVMAVERPDVPQDAAATCILQGMTVTEVLTTPNSPMVRDSAAMGVFVRDVMLRPGVAACLDAAAT